MRQEKLNQVRRAVMSVENDKHREAIVLFFFEELSQKDIAERMGATESAVSTWVYRGKKEIEKYLIETDFQQ
jgi:RNA polymerase sigma factor (sigma-70 family)